MKWLFILLLIVLIGFRFNRTLPPMMPRELQDCWVPVPTFLPIVPWRMYDLSRNRGHTSFQNNPSDFWLWSYMNVLCSPFPISLFYFPLCLFFNYTTKLMDFFDMSKFLLLKFINYVYLIHQGWWFLWHVPRLSYRCYMFSSFFLLRFFSHWFHSLTVQSMI